MTAQVPVEKTRSTPDGDVFPKSLTESLGPITNSTSTAGAAEQVEDTPTVAFAAGADDAAVRGVDEVLGREVRLVTLPPASGEVLSERIEQVRHLARLHHPHLLEVYDVDGLAPDTESTLVLENVPGEPLALVLREGPIGEPEVARMGAQLASALAHAHAHGVEHGAIGASSVLVHRAHADAWLVGLTASLSGPLPVVDPDADGDDGGASQRRAADVRALAGVLAGIVEHGAAVTGGDDPEAVTRPVAREDEVPASPLTVLLRTVDADPPSAEAFSRQLVRVGRGVAAREGREAPARLVPVVASWSESPAAGPPLPVSGPRSGPSTPADGGAAPEQVVPAALAAGPAVRTRGTGGVTPFTVIGPAGRRARRAGVLGAATATLALASGLVIWAGESHLVRPESQAEIGAAAPSAVAPAPLLPQATDAGSTPGGTWSGASDHSAVGVASRKAALPEQRSASRAAETSRVQSTTTTDDPPPTTRPSESSDPRPDGPPVVPPPGTRTTHPRPTGTPSRTTTPPTTDPTTKPPTTDPTTPTTTGSTTTRTTTTVRSSTATSSTATSSTGASSTTTTSPEPAAADPASLVQAAATEPPSTPVTTTLPGRTVLAAGT